MWLIEWHATAGPEASDWTEPRRQPIRRLSLCGPSRAARAHCIYSIRVDSPHPLAIVAARSADGSHWSLSDRSLTGLLPRRPLVSGAPDHWELTDHSTSRRPERTAAIARQ